MQICRVQLLSCLFCEVISAIRFSSCQSLDLVTKERGCACIRGNWKIPGGDNTEDVSGMGRESNCDPTGHVRCPDRLEDGEDLEARKAAEWLRDNCALDSGLVVRDSG